MKPLPVTIVALLALASGHADAAATSENNAKLKQALETWPQADANRDGVLTMEEAKSFRRQTLGTKKDAKDLIPPTHGNLAYGPHARHKLDLWLTDKKRGDTAPLLICIHGGGFRGGDKNKYRQNPALLQTMLDAGISVAAINYRLTDGGAHPYPIPMHDGARAVQYLRYHAKKYGLNKSRFGATGGSAGACMLMWLGFHEDMADPDHEDPVLRESTRLHVLAPNAGQPCVHMPTLVAWFEVDRLTEHPGGRPLFGLPPEGEIEWTEELNALALDASPITHLTKDAPPVYMVYGTFTPIRNHTPSGTWVHHPIMGIKLKERMDALGLECYLQYKGEGAEEITAYANQNAFLIEKLTE